MKLIKKLTAVSLALCILFTLSLSAVASPNPEITPYSWSQLSKTQNSFDLNTNTGETTMTAGTTGNGDSTKTTVEIYLERLHNGVWETVPGMSWSSTSSTNSVIISKIRWVEKGYNYRLRSEHSATGANGTEYDTIYSDFEYYG